VVNALGELPELFDDALLLCRHHLRQLEQVVGQHLPFVVAGEEFAQVIDMLVQHLSHLAQALGLGSAHLTADQFCRYIHAVEDITDVVQHRRGDFGHARLTGFCIQFGLHLAHA